MKIKNASPRTNGVYAYRTKVQSMSDGRKWYLVAKRKTDNRWTCSCLSWIRFKNSAGTDCKHIKEVKKAIKNDGRRKKPA